MFSGQLWDCQELPALFHLYISTVKASNIPSLYLKNGADLETLAEQGVLQLVIQRPHHSISLMAVWAFVDITSAVWAKHINYSCVHYLLKEECFQYCCTLPSVLVGDSWHQWCQMITIFWRASQIKYLPIGICTVPRASGSACQNYKHHSILQQCADCRCSWA